MTYQTMKNGKGDECVISEKLYRLKEDLSMKFGDLYEEGNQVKLIGGLYKEGIEVNLLGELKNPADKPGHHYFKGLVLITSPKAIPADCWEVKKKQLELIVSL